MNVIRLGGMALALVGLIVVLISRLQGYQLGLYLGLIVVLVGFIIYVAGVFSTRSTAQTD